LIKKKLEDGFNKIITSLKAANIKPRNAVTGTITGAIIPRVEIDSIYIVSLALNASRGKFVAIDNITTLTELKAAINKKFNISNTQGTVVITFNNGVECDVDSDNEWVCLKKNHSSIKTVRIEK